MTKECPNCGKENNEKSTFCINCGEKLAGQIYGIKDKNKILIGVSIVLIILIAIVGVFAFMSFDDIEKKTELSNRTDVNQTENISDVLEEDTVEKESIEDSQPDRTIKSSDGSEIYGHYTESDILNIMMDYDSNGDGKVDKKEMKAQTGTSSGVLKYDSNGDGKLNRREFIRYYDSLW